MFETQGATRNRTRDLHTKLPAHVTSSDHRTAVAHVLGGADQPQRGDTATVTGRTDTYDCLMGSL